MNYKYWLSQFSKDKKLISTFDICHIDSIHTIRRYVGPDGIRWETAITYTNKIVIRKGQLAPDGISIKWDVWETAHDVEFE